VLSTHHTLHLTAKTITLDDGTKASYNELAKALAGIEGQRPQQAAQKRQKQRGDAGAVNQFVFFEHFITCVLLLMHVLLVLLHCITARTCM
jgi:hypothetical protein